MRPAQRTVTSLRSKLRASRSSRTWPSPYSASFVEPFLMRIGASAIFSTLEARPK